MGSARAGEIQSLLALMRLQALGRHVSIWPAPKRQVLACFGGTMTIDEFRSFGGHTEPPQVYWPFEKLYVPIIGGESIHKKITAMTSSSDGRAQLRAIENSSSENDTLRLKRSKPLSRAESKLENVLGIKRKEKI
jgi:hypothetical protein